ncbi:BspA family leucine-rich repeat surface protein [Escherichia coli]
MSTVYPGWKADLLALVNRNNKLSLKESDVKFESFIPAEYPEACQVTIKPGDNSPYFFEQSLTYVRRDIAKAFTGIPLRFIVSTDVAFKNIVDSIAEKYGMNFDLAVDFLETDLNKKITFETSGIQSAELPIAESSYVWSGNLQVQVVNDTLNLITIIQAYQLTGLHYIQETDMTKGSLALATTAALGDLAIQSVDKSVGTELPIEYFERMLSALVGSGEISEDDKAQAITTLQTAENRTVLFVQRGAAQIAITQKDDWQIGNLYGSMVVCYYTDNGGKYILKATGGKVQFYLGGWDKVNIDWGDGNKVTEASSNNSYSHDYADTGEYTIVATGMVKDGNVTQTIKGSKITEIVNWDNGMFCSPSTNNLASLRTVPNRIPEKWTSLAMLFNYLTTLNDPNIQEWDVSRITNMSKTFLGCQKLNLDFSKWNVSRVTNMSYMFSSCLAFVGNGLDKWDVSKVNDMSFMFSSSAALDGDKLVNWKTDSLVDASSMFSSMSFNSDISGWNTSKLQSVSNMFAYNTAFNQDISGWNTRSLRKIDLMMRENTAFNQDLSGWDVSNVISGKDNVGQGATNWPRERWPGYVAA